MADVWRGVVIDGNFKFAGEALADVWRRGMVIGGCETDAKWADPPAEPRGPTLMRPSKDWVARHCRQGQHCSQVVKCGTLEARQACREEHGETGCKEPRSNLLDVLPGRFLPTPVPVGMVGGCLKVD